MATAGLPQPGREQRRNWLTATKSKPFLENLVPPRAATCPAETLPKISGMHTRTFRDRRGRGLRGPLLPMEAPRYRTRGESFDVAVLEAYAPIQHSYPGQLAHLDIAVDTVPRMRLRSDTILPDEIVADGPVPLGRVIPAGIDAQGRPTRARLVLFRMPIEQRCANPQEREELLTGILTALVAQYLNLDPRDIDPDFQF